MLHEEIHGIEDPFWYTFIVPKVFQEIPDTRRLRESLVAPRSEHNTD